MPIVVNLDVMLAKRKMNLTELSFRVGITIANMSILKSGKMALYQVKTEEEVFRHLFLKENIHLRQFLTLLEQQSNGHSVKY